MANVRSHRATEPLQCGRHLFLISWPRFENDRHVVLPAELDHSLHPLGNSALHIGRPVFHRIGQMHCLHPFTAHEGNRFEPATPFSAIRTLPPHMITLASDFGTPYPAAMKGAILQRSDARLVDIAHNFPRQDVRAAAFWLRETLPEFPPATHLVVVDPGVGTERAALAIEAGSHHLIAPDNGVAVPAARELAGDDEFAVYDIAYDKETASNTFHGRDVFAPVAAELHEAGGAADVARATPTPEWVDLTFPEPNLGSYGATGEALVVDDFGNTVSNIPGHLISARDSVTANGIQAPVRRSYAAVEEGERLITVGSHGYVEFAVNRGRGDEGFDLQVGETVELSW